MARQPTISTESVAQDQIRAFVERILRMKEEAKAINDDIREIYAEAKGNGFDKTVLGQVVSYVEKRQKDPDTLAERSALFDLYLGALDGTSDQPLTRMRVRDGSNIDENGDGPIRRMTKARQEIFDALEGEGVIPGRDTGRCVYFLHAPTAGLLKIGSSDDVRARVRGIQGASPAPLFLIGTVSGGLKRELELHSRFAERRAHGEWFAVDDDFLDEIASLIEAEPVALTHTHEAEPNSTAPIPPGVAADAEEQTHSSDAGSSAPIQPETANEVPETNDGGPNESAHAAEVNDWRRRHTTDEPDTAEDTHDDMGAENRPVDTSEEPGRSLASDTPSNVHAFQPIQLRPHCLNRDVCAGQGRRHCYSCDKAHSTALPITTGGTEIEHHGGVA